MVPERHIPARERRRDCFSDGRGSCKSKMSMSLCRGRGFGWEGNVVSGYAAFSSSLYHPDKCSSGVRLMFNSVLHNSAAYIARIKPAYNSTERCRVEYYVSSAYIAWLSA